MTNSYKTNSWTLRAMIAPGVAIIAMLVVIADGHADAQNPVLPPLSVAKCFYFQAHPEVWSQFLAHLPRRPTGPQAVQKPVPTPFGGTWSLLNNPLGSNVQASNPLLLTDGTVIVHDAEAADRRDLRSGGQHVDRCIATEWPRLDEYRRLRHRHDERRNW
jgi:hypothetical protein